MSLDYRLKFTKFEENQSKVSISRAQIYEGYLERNRELLALGGQVGVASEGTDKRRRSISFKLWLWQGPIPMFAQWFSVSWKNYCCRNKPIYLCEMYAVLQFWRLHHTSQRQLSIGKLHCVMAGDYCYGQKVMSYDQNIFCIWVCSFKSGRTNMYDKERSQ